MPYDSRMGVGTVIMLIGLIVAAIAGGGYAIHLWTEHTMFISGGIGLAIVALGGLFATGSGNLPP